MPRRAAPLIALLVLVLAGCVPAAPTPTTTPAPGETPESSVTPTAAPTATATPVPGPESVAVTLGCSELLSPQAIYDYNPNVSLLDSFSPGSGTLAGDAVTLQGIACRLVNQTSGETIDIGVVQFTPEAFAAKVASVDGSSDGTNAYDGYFEVSGGEGVAQAFSDPYWVTLTSPTFLSPEDAAPLVQAALGAL